MLSDPSLNKFIAPYDASMTEFETVLQMRMCRGIVHDPPVHVADLGASLRVIPLNARSWKSGIAMPLVQTSPVQSSLLCSVTGYKHTVSYCSSRETTDVYMLQLTPLCNGLKLEMPFVVIKPVNDRHSPSFSGKRNTQSSPKLKAWQNSAVYDGSQYREQNVSDVVEYLTTLADTASSARMTGRAVAESVQKTAATTLSLKRLMSML